MAHRNTHRIMGGVFIVMGLLMTLAALIDLMQGFEDGLSFRFIFPAMLAGFFLAGGTYVLVSGRGRKRGS
jgi:hypothetical protein